VQRLAEGRQVLESVARVALHRAQQYLLESARDVRTVDARPIGRLGEDAREHLAQVRAAVRRPAREQRVERRSGRVHVAALVDLAALDLFRRGVDRRAEEGSRLRQLHVRVERARESEVADLDVPVLGDEAVRGLDVAVQHARAVRRVEPLQQLDRPAHGLAHRDARALLDHLLERLSAHELHRDRGRALELVRAVDEHAARVRDRGGQHGLALETLERLVRGDELRRQHLERQFAARAQLAREVDHAHPAPAELAHDLEAVRAARERRLRALGRPFQGGGIVSVRQMPTQSIAGQGVKRR
jgi:hypothetical protein